ncbi:putative cerato-platanin [Lyophyllum shimeji]|uniref:Cerato-platanin n=1 Tax=Lyophyllum shimeji TaxID=47721 RepID=A0A9P3PHF7_LYOSH|nr:putative cerato-platanin [Lyophyllum shimeji]
MQFRTIALSAVLAFVSSAQGVTLSYDRSYDNGSASLNTVACSDGANGLITRGFTTFGSLPKFPFIGGAVNVAAWNSPNCGTCYELTYTNSTGGTKSINILAIDVSKAGYNIALGAMEVLVGPQAVALGRVEVAVRQVGANVCGL